MEKSSFIQPPKFNSSPLEELPSRKERSLPTIIFQGGYVTHHRCTLYETAARVINTPSCTTRGYLQTFICHYFWKKPSTLRNRKLEKHQTCRDFVRHDWWLTTGMPGSIMEWLKYHHRVNISSSCQNHAGHEHDMKNVACIMIHDI